MSITLFIKNANPIFFVLYYIAVCGLFLHCLFAHHLLNGTNFGEELWNRRSMFLVSVQILSEIFLILRSQRYVITSVNTFSCKLLAFFSEFNHNWTCRQIFEKSSNIKFYENSPSWNQFFHTDRRTDGRTDKHDEANNNFSQTFECVYR